MTNDDTGATRPPAPTRHFGPERDHPIMPTPCLLPVRLTALDVGPDLVLDRLLMVVGRHPDCDARPRSIRVSRRHCCLTAVDGAVIVRDLGSTNGTRINGRRVEAGRLRPGDELSIANLRYQLGQGQANRASTADSRAGLRGDSAPPADPPGTSLFDES
jgi:hypothetical protein